MTTLVLDESMNENRLLYQYRSGIVLLMAVTKYVLPVKEEYGSYRETYQTKIYK